MSRVERLRQISGWLAILSATMGVSALLGRIWDTDPFEVLRIDAAPIKPGASVCLVLLGGALWLQLQSRLIMRRAGMIAALVSLVFILLSGDVRLFAVAMIVAGFSGALFSIEPAEITERGEDAEKARQALMSQLQEQTTKMQAALEERTRDLRLVNERHREATQNLELLNERLRLALHSAQLGVWELDVAADHQTWDSRVHEMFGFTEEEFDGSLAMCLARVHPDDRSPAEEHLRRVLAGEVADYMHTFRVVHPDGSVRHIDSRAYLQRDAHGNARRLVGLSRDITEDRHRTHALELAGQRWQLALEATNDSLWDWEIVSGRVFHDERWAGMLGYEPGELKDTFAAWKELVHPDDLAADESAVRSHFEARTPYYQAELRVRAKDGTWRWILKRGKVVRRAADGQPLRMTGMHTDVTPRKHLEQQLQKSAMLAAEVSRLAQIGGWQIDLITRQATWTEGARRIHEVDDSFQPTMESIWQFFANDARATVESAINTLTASSPAFDVQVPLLTIRGSRRWVRMLGRAEFLDGRPITVHGAVQDITAEHESSEARLELEAQLFQVQKMETLGTFAGGIAHDFNNILTGITGYHELAADTLAEDHPAQSSLVQARNASLRARDLVDQILTFGRPASAVTHGPIDLPNVIEEARRFLRTTLPATIKIEVNCAANCGPVLADATQLNQVILHLASNAAHAMRDSSGVLKIALASADSSQNIAVSSDCPAPTRYVRLSISDTGHGMDKATRHRIFDPFFTTKKTSGGTGLGLAVVHGIVRSHCGTIDVESEPGRGTTFHIYLPAAADEPKPAEDSNKTTPGDADEFICVVDDEEVVGTCTKLVLESKGYRSVIFKSAELCLAEFQANPSGCAVLVTDQTMPGMQGTELAATLRRIAPQLPVVIMSGNFSKIPSQVLDDLGQVELLGKPFTTDELMGAVRRALRPVR